MAPSAEYAQKKVVFLVATQCQKSDDEEKEKLRCLSTATKRVVAGRLLFGNPLPPFAGNGCEDGWMQRGGDKNEAMHLHFTSFWAHKAKTRKEKKEKDVRKEKEKKTERKGAPLFEKRESIWNVRFSGAKMLSYKISNPLVWRSHHFMAAQGFGRREGRCDTRTWGDVSLYGTLS